MAKAEKAEEVEITSGQAANYYRHKGFDSVRIHFGIEVQHMESRARFTCKKHFHSHGTFWLKVQDVVDAEEAGLSACPCCAALEEKETVDFSTFKDDVAEQRKVQKKIDDKQAVYSRRRGSAGLDRYVL